MFIPYARYLTRHKPSLFNAPLQQILQPSVKCIPFMSFNRTMNLVNKQYFSSKKQKNSPIQKKPQQPQIKQVEDSQFLWKFSTALNLISVGCGFYFPKEVLMFALMSNGMFQVYQSSKTINKLIEIGDKSEKLTYEQSRNAINDVKGKFRSLAITGGIVVISSILTGLGIIYPEFAEYSLIGLPFWILYNLKFNNLSQGYYFALMALALFQYFYFSKMFQTEKKKQSL